MNSLLSQREELFWPFQQRFDKIFDSLFGLDSLSATKSLARSGYPKVDVLAKGNQYRVQAAVPGVKLEDLRVEVDRQRHGNDDFKVLKISGKMEERYQPPEDAIYHLRELRRSYFERKLLLPDHLEGEPDAILQDGILTLTWAVKVPETPKAKLIEVREKT
jgi:HSP20 family protein